MDDAGQRMTAIDSASASVSAAISIVPVAPCGRFSLRVDPAAVAGLHVRQSLRLDLPINSCLADGEHSCARLGPDEWLLLTPETETDRMAQDVRAALSGRFFSLVDISHRNVAFSVTGPRARDTINSGSPLDLSDRAFPAGTATRTLLGQAEIVLIRGTGEPAYRVECWRSFARYVHGILKTSAAEFSGT
jgi:sarcosine oxidase subunit gamma